MGEELRGSLRCRNYATALRMIAAGNQIDKDLALLCVAESYQRLADLLERIHRSRSAAQPSLS
jgi:hypothetical protein